MSILRQLLPPSKYMIGRSLYGIQTISCNSVRLIKTKSSIKESSKRISSYINEVERDQNLKTAKFQEQLHVQVERLKDLYHQGID